MFEGLPKKFTGNTVSNQDVTSWVKNLSFIRYQSLGQAYEWFKKFKELKPKNTIQNSLASLFLGIWGSIPIAYYTKEIVMNTYLSKNICNRQRDLEEITDTYFRIKKKYDNKSDKILITVNNLDKDYNEVVEESNKSDPIKKLTQTDCYAKHKTANEESERKKQNTSMLALFSGSKKSQLVNEEHGSAVLNSQIIAAFENKRIRIGNLIDNHYPSTTQKVDMNKTIPKLLTIEKKNQRNTQN
ncbi:hypothetical protein BB561_005117 [Smittium simulii]|uniref:Uncharacterized protein n=1 Tax=Smittium simulii TaxID=133385 RepID=A0A2T9YC78_9FUNG|nr:hypothetical protein BB561_005117 [Smittium simulii]